MIFYCSFSYSKRSMFHGRSNTLLETPERFANIANIIIWYIHYTLNHHVGNNIYRTAEANCCSIYVIYTVVVIQPNIYTKANLCSISNLTLKDTFNLQYFMRNRIHKNLESPNSVMT